MMYASTTKTTIPTWNESSAVVAPSWLLKSPSSPSPPNTTIRTATDMAENTGKSSSSLSSISTSQLIFIRWNVCLMVAHMISLLWGVNPRGVYAIADAPLLESHRARIQPED